MAGRPEKAKRRFQDVLRLRGDDFRASVYLGRIALLQGDLGTATREWAAAKRSDPERFAKIREELEEFLASRPIPVAGIEEARSDNASPEAFAAAEQSGYAWLWYVDTSNQGGPYLGGSSLGGSSLGSILGSADSAGDSLGLDGAGLENPTNEGFCADGPGGHSLAWSSLWMNPDGQSDDEDPAEAWPPVDGLEELLGLEAESIADEVADELSPGDDDEFWDDEAGNFDVEIEEPTWARPLASFYEDLEAEARGGAAHPNLGDFSTHDEAERFRSMPPIGRAELEDINWDEFAARIEDFE